MPRAALADEASQEAKEEARVLLEKGKELARNNDWEKAHEAFCAAWKKSQHPHIAANLGQTALHTKRPGQAVEFLSRFLREGDDISAADRQATEAMIAKAKERAIAIDVVVGTPYATVYLDGLKIGTSPLPRQVWMDIGPHTLTAQTPEGAEAKLDAEIIRGVHTRLILTFPEPAKAEALGPANSGEAATPESKPNRERPVVISVGIGLTALGLGLGLAGTLISNARSSELDVMEDEIAAGFGDDPSEAAWNATNRRRVTWANLAEGAFIGAGVAALATASYALLSPRSEGPKRDVAATDIQFSAAPGMAGIALVKPW